MTFGGISSADIFKTLENKWLFAKVINTVTNKWQKGLLSKRRQMQGVNWSLSCL
jgi:hypothetical protein